MAKKKGALAKDPPKAAAPKPTPPKQESKPANASKPSTSKPSNNKPSGSSNTPTTSKRGNWKYNGIWVNKDGYKVDNYGKVIKGQNKPFVPANKNPFAPKPDAPGAPGATPAPAPTDPFTGAPNTPFEQLNPDQRSEEISQGLGGLMRGNIDQAQPFNPGTFDEQANAAYQNVMNQFNADNAAAFQQQEAAFFQRAAEQGLDPNNPGYAALYKQEVTDRQDRARQQASRTALDASQSVRQQGFNQSYQQFLAPGEQFGQFAPAWGSIEQARQTGQISEAELANRLKIAQIQQKGGGGGGGGGAAQPTLFDRWQQQNIASGYAPTPNANVGNNLVIGGTQGAGNQFVNNLNKKQGQ